MTNWFSNQGQLYAVQDAAGLRSLLTFDVEDRLTNSCDANAVCVSMTYDNLGRLLSRTYPDTGSESFGYSPGGLVAYTNQLGKGSTHSLGHFWVQKQPMLWVDPFPFTFQRRAA